MVNVKALLANWKNQLEAAYKVLGTDKETMSIQEFKILEEQIAALEKAIRIDQAWANEEAEFKSHIG